MQHVTLLTAEKAEESLEAHATTLVQLQTLYSSLESLTENGGTLSAEGALYLRHAVNAALLPIGETTGQRIAFESYESAGRKHATMASMEELKETIDRISSNIEVLEVANKKGDVASHESLGLLVLAGGVIAALHYFLEVRPERKKKEEIAKYAAKSNEGKGEVEAWKLVSELHKLVDNKKSFETLPLKNGKINGKWISSNLAGSKTDPKDIIQRIEKHLSIVKKVVDETNANIAKNVKKLKELGQQIETLATEKSISLDAATTEVMKQHHQELIWPARMSSSDVAQLIGQHGVTLFDGSKVNIDENAGVDSVDQLDALTHSQIENIVKRLDNIYFIESGLYLLDTDTLYGPYEGDRAPMKHVVEWAAKDNGGQHDVSNLVMRKSIDYTWGYAVSSCEYAVEEAIEALGRWIVHSIEWTPELKKTLGLDK